MRKVAHWEIRRRFEPVVMSAQFNCLDDCLSLKGGSVSVPDDPTEPDMTLIPPSYLVSIEYNPKDPNILAGGCYNGQICWWDSRKGGNPEGTISLEQSHIDPVYKTIWLNAKAGTDFFTASTDGTVSDNVHLPCRHFH